MNFFLLFRLMNYFDFYICFCFLDEIEVACLKIVKKDDFIMFFKVYVYINYMFIILNDFDIFRNYIEI